MGASSIEETVTLTAHDLQTIEKIISCSTSTSKAFLKKAWSSFSYFCLTEPAPTAQALKMPKAFCTATSCASLSTA